MNAPSVSPAAASALTLADRAQDVGNIVFLEHIYLQTPDLEVARLFYAEGLGLTQDPGTLGSQRGGLNVVHYNVGRQQIHIEKGPAPQTLPVGGAIGLVVPGIEALTQRLEMVQQFLGDVRISHINPGMIEVQDPHGLTFVIHESYPDFPSDRGICYLLLPCHVGAAAGIARFYQDFLGATVTQEGSSKSNCEVVVGPGTRLLFKEVAGLKERTNKGVTDLWSGWHLAMYVADFSSVYERIAGSNLIDNTHPFRDKCYSLADALQNRQLRFLDIVDGSPIQADGGNGGKQEQQAATRELLYRFSHEVRSLHHPRFLRPLYNRGGSNFDASERI